MPKDLAAPPDYALNRTPREVIRHNNFMQLLDDIGRLEGKRGVLLRLAERVAIPANVLSQIKNKHMGIGDGSAKKIEVGLHLGRGWLDVEHTDWLPETPDEQAHFSALRVLFRQLPKKDQAKALRAYAKFVRAVTKK